ncbi:hypothetical protein RCL1_000007 [Eukaryota sp. TZLM3-RCL]
MNKNAQRLQRFVGTLASDNSTELFDKLTKTRTNLSTKSSKSIQFTSWMSTYQKFEHDIIKLSNSLALTFDSSSELVDFRSAFCNLYGRLKNANSFKDQLVSELRQLLSTFEQSFSFVKLNSCNNLLSRFLQKEAPKVVCDFSPLARFSLQLKEHLESSFITALENLDLQLENDLLTIDKSFQVQIEELEAKCHILLKPSDTFLTCNNNNTIKPLELTTHLLSSNTSESIIVEQLTEKFGVGKKVALAFIKLQKLLNRKKVTELGLAKYYHERKSNLIQSTKSLITIKVKELSALASRELAETKFKELQNQWRQLLEEQQHDRDQLIDIESHLCCFEEDVEERVTVASSINGRIQKLIKTVVNDYKKEKELNDLKESTLQQLHEREVRSKTSLSNKLAAERSKYREDLYQQKCLVLQQQRELIEVEKKQQEDRLHLLAACVRPNVERNSNRVLADTTVSALRKTQDGAVDVAFGHINGYTDSEVLKDRRLLLLEAFSQRNLLDNPLAKHFFDTVNIDNPKAVAYNRSNVSNVNFKD